jgi:hypothetical protein
LWRIVASIDKIPSKIRKLWTGHDIYLQIDNVDLEWASATLTLEVGVWLLRMTHCLIIKIICARIFQIPLINKKIKAYTYTCTVQVSVTCTPEEHAHWLAHFAGVYLLWRQRRGKRQKYHIQMLIHWLLFFLGFILWQQETCFYVWIWYKRERASKHSAIWFILGVYTLRTNQFASCFDAFSIT